MNIIRNDYYTEDKYQFILSLVESGVPATRAVQVMCNNYNLEQNSTVERAYRARINRRGLGKPVEVISETDEFKKAKEKTFDSKKDKFIITWCQSETEIHGDFLTNIEAYAKHIDADIHVIAGRYSNPSSLGSSKQQEKKDKNKNYWNERVIPYLDANRQNIHKYLCVLADVKIQPTATTPLSGFNGITALESCIIGHPRVHLKSLPVLDGYPNKLLLTTGAVSLPNYTDTKVGAKGDFHHTFGFVIVEIDDEDFHIRQVQCSDNGSFYDLDLFINNGSVSKYSRCPAIVFGDIHYGHHHDVALKASMDMARRFSVDAVILHDIFDGKSINHHEVNQPFLQLNNEEDGSIDLEREITDIVNFINSNNDLNYVVVSSNHDDFLNRWLINTDWRRAPNRKAYLKYANIMASGEAPNGIIPYVLTTYTDNCKCLGLNDSYRIHEWELSIHGHIGQNGSRGSIGQFKNLNTKTITAHSHSPAREDGSLIVGTLTRLRLGYNSGASSWIHSNVLIYPNGKASHINIINGKYTTLV
jgi:hypothetical protein